MKIATLIIRSLYALMLLGAGANHLFHFAPMPEYPFKASAFLYAVNSSGYIFPLVGVVFIVTGASLLANLYVALMLVVSAPIIVNIVLFHVFLDMKTAVPSLAMLAFHLFLFYKTRHLLLPMLTKR